MLISGTNETPIIATELPLSESGFLFTPGGRTPAMARITVIR
jgi:hypothetical protein